MILEEYHQAWLYRIGSNVMYQTPPASFDVHPFNPEECWAALCEFNSQKDANNRIELILSAFYTTSEKDHEGCANAANTIQTGGESS